jgi:hypothetical protein
MPIFANLLLIAIIAISGSKMIFAQQQTGPKIQCSATVVACGELGKKFAGLAVDGEQCYELELVRKGDDVKGVVISSKIFVGMGIEVNTIVFGVAKAQSGIVLECKFEPGVKDSKERLEALKQSLPELLKTPTIKEKFPQVTKIDLLKLTKVREADKSQSDKISQFAKDQQCSPVRLP